MVLILCWFAAGLILIAFEKGAISFILCFWAVMLIIGRLGLSLRRAEKRACTDRLTGLLNRNACDLLDRQMELARKEGSVVSVLMVDVDNFKKINDVHGHPVGDIVLKAVGEKLLASVRTDLRSDRPCDLALRVSWLSRILSRRGRQAFRLGGEEFALMLPATSLTNSVRVAERIRTELEAMSIPIGGGQELRVTASFGVAVSTAKIQTADVILLEADKALYAAKKSGRNRVVSMDQLSLPKCAVLPSMVSAEI